MKQATSRRQALLSTSSAALLSLQFSCSSEKSSGPSGKTIHDHNDVVENELSVETLAIMLVRGEFPENYDEIIREISDDDFERLWEFFDEKR